VLEQEPAVDEVITAGLVPVVDVRGAELDVRDSALAGRFPRERQWRIIHVHPGDRTGRPGQRRKLKGHRTAAAPQIQAPHARAQPRAAD
jgi:hypothetical protein